MNKKKLVIVKKQPQLIIIASPVKHFIISEIGKY